MYKLELTKVERDAFDFVDTRYYTGWDVRWELEQCLPADKTWDSPDTIVFEVPEYRAWNIQHLSEKEANLWPLFANDLKAKMIGFCERIV